MFAFLFYVICKYWKYMNLPPFQWIKNLPLLSVAFHKANKYMIWNHKTALNVTNQMLLSHRRVNKMCVMEVNRLSPAYWKAKLQSLLHIQKMWGHSKNEWNLNMATSSLSLKYGYFRSHKLAKPASMVLWKSWLYDLMIVLKHVRYKINLICIS